MRRRIVSVLVLSAALLLQPVYAGVGGLGQAMANQSQYVNFTSDGEQDIVIPPGKTDVFPTCYNLTDPEFRNKTGKYFLFNCTSPVSDVTCDHNQSNTTHCVCHNGSKKSHTVKVHMDDYCHDPNQE